MTPCECTSPGFCERHVCQKSRHWWRLCRSDEAVFAQWEAGCGPGQDLDRPVPADRLVAPLRGVPVHRKPWEGICPKKPWDYQVALCVNWDCLAAHRSTPFTKPENQQITEKAFSPITCMETSTCP